MLKTRHSSSLEYHSRSDEYYFEVFLLHHCLLESISLLDSNCLNKIATL